MAVYLVTWNINKARNNYDQARRDFISNLENLDNIADSGLESVRWISTTSTTYQLEEYLRKKLDDNDRLFVCLLRLGDHQGWLHQSTWDWINARL